MRAHSLSFLALIVILAALVCAGTAHAEDMVVTHAWAPPSTSADTAVAYLTLSNHGVDDTLKTVDSPCCANVELHSMDMTDGIMRMRRLDKLDLPGGQSVEFGPDDMHFMLIGLKAPLTDGQTLTITLHFDHAPDLAVEIPVSAARLRDSLKSPTGMSM